MPKERQKMQAFTTLPARYFLVTACSLTPGNKDSILQAMRPFVQSTADIYGADDLDALLHEYPRIYRKHFRLWLHSVEQLSQYLNQAHHVRAEMVFERLLAEAKNYVVPTAQPTIVDQLATHHSCLIVGDPGSGKSATAGQVALEQQIENPNAELIWIDDQNFEQALQLIQPGSEQIIVLDDFLGATFLQDNGLLAFKRDWQTLLSKGRQANGKLKLLFTTRDYILEQALTQLGEHRGNIAQLCGNAVRMGHTSAKFRAKLVHSLVQAAGFTEAQLITLVREKLYWPLIKTAHFSPRHIAMFCDKLTTVPAGQLKATIEQGIQNQQQLWLEVFRRQSHEAQTLLYLCALAGQNANATELKRTFNTLYPAVQGRVAPLNGFDQALIELEPTFITTSQHLSDIWVSPVNPSLVDFLHHSIIDNTPLVDALIQSLEHFDWGLGNFQLTGGSSNPIPLKAKQRDALTDTLLELLNESGSRLMQTYKYGSLEWCNKRDTSGAKVTTLWHSVMGNPEEAQRLIEKLRYCLPETAQWPDFYKQSSMMELLDITRYMGSKQQFQLWVLAMRNLSHSEGAAALAQFYQQHRQVQKALKQHWQEMRASMQQACDREKMTRII